MNDLAIREEPRQLAQLSDSDLIRVMTNSLYPGAKSESCALVLSYCRAAGLDPMQKPVHIVPMSVKVGKDKYEWRDVIMPGIDQYRIKASRSGEYVGLSKPEFGPLTTYKLGTTEVTVPEWCEVTAKRMVRGIVAEFTAVEFWIENYATAGKDTKAPNAMWSRRSRGQLAKCAEAQALRKAFPEFTAGPTAEEMEGKVIDITGEQVDHDFADMAKPVEQPRSRSAPPQPQASYDTPSAPREATPTEDKPLGESALRILRAKAANAGVDDAALELKFGPISSLRMSQFNDIQKFISERAA